MRHLHLDPVGGVAGDMFVGALLDLHPTLAAATIAAVRAAGLDDHIALAHLPCSDGILSGSRFAVSRQGMDAVPVADPAQAGHHRAHGHGQPHNHAEDHAHHHDADHAPVRGRSASQGQDSERAHTPTQPRPAAEPHTVRWATLRHSLQTSALAPAVRDRALDIFSRLAVAEARVHAVAVDVVAFHEVGAWDSIADIVASAHLIEALGPCSWSIGALPLGSGRVRSAHGLLPVPAPATALLLEGYACFDDGLPGERVTPTGAAILNHLGPAAGLGTTRRRLVGSAYGFGTRRFEGISNVLRVLEFDQLAARAPGQDDIVEIRFEVDDQTAEDLAVGLDHLRALDGVLDVGQFPITGKQGRLAAAIQVLARPAATEAVTSACFRETTTLGLRVQPVERRILRRREVRTADGLHVKVAARGDGETAKTEIADVAAVHGQALRNARRDAAVDAVLDDENHEK